MKSKKETFKGGLSVGEVSIKMDRLPFGGLHSFDLKSQGNSPISAAFILSYMQLSLFNSETIMCKCSAVLLN